jgi:hypothetical protein
MSERAHSGILATPIPFRIRPSKCEEIRMEIGSERKITFRLISLLLMSTMVKFMSLSSAKRSEGTRSGSNGDEIRRGKVLRRGD